MTLSGDAILILKKKYGVTISTVESSSPADLVSTASMSNDNLYDVMYESFRNTGTRALAGQLDIIFNRDLIRENNLDDPYEPVEADDWYLNTMFEMAAKVSNDLDGDDVRTNTDFYGFLSEESAGASAFFLIGGCGVTFVSKTEDGLTKSSM